MSFVLVYIKASCAEGAHLTAAVVDGWQRVVELCWVVLPVRWACKRDAGLGNGLDVSASGGLQDNTVST
jgi:hypothetical protein